MVAHNSTVIYLPRLRATTSRYPADILVSFVGKSIYSNNRSYIWSYGRYISIIADIIQVTVDIFR